MVDLHLMDRTVRIAPDKPGTTDSWPSDLTPPLHFLTAWDPGHERPGEAANRTRQAALERDLDAQKTTYWRAVGFDLDSEHREEGVAVAGVPEAEVLALARHYGQRAIFIWTPRTWETVSCVDDRRQSAGWLLVPPVPRTQPGSSASSS